MLRASGFRLFRLGLHIKSLERDASKAGATPAEFVRKAAKRRGLLLCGEGVNPAQPFRWRKLSDDYAEVEQVQDISGRFAGVPPEQADFFERFQGGEAWGGVVKKASLGRVTGPGRGRGKA